MSGSGWCWRGIKNRGFTLIEILITAIIFSLLTGIAIVNYQSVNRRARDGKRMADLEEVRTKLEIYRADLKVYPAGAGVGSTFAEMVATLIGGGYLTTTPADPLGYSYYYNSPAGRDYVLCAYLERGGTVDCGTNCGTAPANCNYQAVSP